MAKARSIRRLAGTLAVVALAVPTSIESAAGAARAEARSTAATADCSRAAALEVGKPFFWDPGMTNPIGQVLCGPFAGPGSQAMAVTFTAPTCWGLQRWVIFHFTAGQWRVVLDQRAFIFPLAVVSSDIRERRPVFRRGDPRCLPSGGSHARTWHWDGTRFTAGPWKQVTPPTTPAGSTGTGYFKTPSGNIVCLYVVGRSANPPLVVCGIRSGLKPAPRRRQCSYGGFVADRVVLHATGRTQVPSCAGDPGPFTGLVVGARVLRYGKTWSGSGLSCTSRFSGLTCRNRSGHGFLLSRSRWRRF